MVCPVCKVLTQWDSAEKAKKKQDEKLQAMVKAMAEAGQSKQGMHKHQDSGLKEPNRSFVIQVS